MAERGGGSWTSKWKWSMNLGIAEVTVYAFSIENFKRNKEEVDNLIDLMRQKFKDLLENKKKLKDDGICIRVFGNLSLLPEDICKLIAEVMIVTRENNRIFINFAVAYTSRDEITHAIKDTIIQGVKDSDILPEDINEDLITDCLYTYKSSYPNLLIRTSGETRLSDFLMWQISNTCIYFIKVLWSEFSLWNFLCAIFYYQRCYSSLQKNKNNLKPIMHNTRVSMFIYKLYNKRDIAIEKIYQSAIQS
ncbi:PREDICTED: LOW QUALITY PROTEIN: dehydrodolichyl diphosphate syntase complex subunit DHDDS-like [Acromyrmex echinatior]|uniref:LOW QUALITY PROTEIN: dehydrodolichyl diphosphate syntase complex subunit DHDDS-like n=1 Tax=Acromyrmex echinatior TaxID=103372 RepID=UPI000580F64A|nr:PREDICTED: LOW QUALITY PROTEIN: dehydrodolichyl diphosphate syntase complex subunit DHDDS-like [Acromyrmex echinatior]